MGEIVDFDLRLTLANGYSGLAVLVVEGPAGTLETYDVVIEEGGTVLLGEGGGYSDLGKAAEDSGLAYRVLFEDGGDEEVEPEARKRPASISPSELAEFVESEERAAGEDQHDSDMEVLGAGAAGRGGSDANQRQEARDRDDRRPVDNRPQDRRPNGLPLGDPQLDRPPLDDAPVDDTPLNEPRLNEPRLNDAPKRGRRASDLRRQPGNGGPLGGRSGWGPGWN